MKHWIVVDSNMYSRTPSASVTRRLERHASTILIGGVIVCLCIFCFLMMCNLPCDKERLHHTAMKQDPYHDGHEPKKRDLGEIKATTTTLKPKNKAFLVILILTGPKNLDRRKAIRETWLENKPDNVLALFAIGLKDLPLDEQSALELENSQHNDLLLLPDFKDAYRALTYKVIEVFTWLEKNVEYTYAFKVDDDSYSKLDVILHELEQEKTAKERLYWGYFRGGQTARLKVTGKWAEKNWIMCDTYLPHALGGGYVLSQDLVRYIAQNQALLQKFNSEDVSVGAWLGPLEIHRIHDSRFNTEWKSRGCNNKHIVSHKQTVEDLYEKHNNLRQLGKLCVEEHQLVPGFIYNWSVVPSKCCVRREGIP